MNHRHLLPDEIDQLLDGEAGFGVAPLLAHVEQCSRCRAELEEARQVLAALEQLPHFALPVGFSDRVMRQVQVFEPWHVTALDAVRRWVPASSGARLLAAGSAFALALVVSATAVWAAVRLDAFLFFFDVASQRARAALVDTIGRAIAGAFGDTALEALRTGGMVASVGVMGFLAFVVLAILALRALVATARRHRA